MTEKDYFKLKDFDLDNYDYLKVNLEISNKEKLFKKILVFMLKKINYFFQAIFVYSFFLIGYVIGIRLSRFLFLFYFYFWSFI